MLDQVQIKPVDPDKRIARLLYIGGATYHNRCCFDLVSDEDSFATLLQKHGIETYAFDNLESHEDNVNFCMDLVREYNIEYLMGYSYGSRVAYDVAQEADIRCTLYVDPNSITRRRLIKVNDTYVVEKHAVQYQIDNNSVRLSRSRAEIFINALCPGERLVVPAYLIDLPMVYDPFNAEVFARPDNRLYLTTQSTLPSRQWNPGSTKYYMDSTHLIMVEPERFDLARDVAEDIKTLLA
jgi:hypothetical protein